ncbi:MAG: SCP2 sterol-binding domain-containing protein [Hyphomicrobiales bacterium]
MPETNALHPLVGALMRPLPLFPLRDALLRAGRTIVWRHRRLIERLGPEARKTFAIEPVDLPFAFVISPERAGMRVEAVRSLSGRAYDARIAGPFLTLVDMSRGRLDGDALFFSRDIQVEGDVSAVVALRNAIDAEGIDIVAEFAALFGPADRLVLGLVERADGFARRYLVGSEPADAEKETGE